MRPHYLDAGGYAGGPPQAATTLPGLEPSLVFAFDDEERAADHAGQL